MTYTELEPMQHAIPIAGATGLELLDMGAGRIHVDDKKIINCRTTRLNRHSY